MTKRKPLPKLPPISAEELADDAYIDALHIIRMVRLLIKTFTEDTRTEAFVTDINVGAMEHLARAITARLALWKKLPTSGLSTRRYRRLLNDLEIIQWYAVGLYESAYHNEDCALGASDEELTRYDVTGLLSVHRAAEIVGRSERLLALANNMRRSLLAARNACVPYDEGQDEIVKELQDEFKAAEF